jgi:hypothetical protein
MRHVCLLALLLGASLASAQSAPVWPQGKTAAIVLSCDDALNSQLDIAIPQLDAAGFKGTGGFHGVGVDYLEVTAEAHQAVLDHLRKHPEVGAAPFREVMDYVSAHSR